MSKDGVDLGRRRFLTATTSVVGAAGAVAAAIPFITYMTPSAKARAAGAPVEVNISKLEPGKLMRVKWRGKPVWIIKRTPEMMKNLDILTKSGRLVDPNSENADQQPKYAQNEYRSIKPNIAVMVGICTHLGCSPTYRPEIAPDDLGADWLGGFLCPCHGSRFDLAGRVFKGVPAQTNLVIPPYKFLTDNELMIGSDQGAA